MSMPESSFQPTSWTLVRRAGVQDAAARAALSDLCAAYYAPVVLFLRRDGRTEDAARESAHAFFAGILTRGVGAPEPALGRFRSYLLGALKHFLAKQRAASLAGKRGGGAGHVPLADESDTAPGYPVPTAPGNAPDWLFDREWAFTLIARALAALEAEQSGKTGQFAVLKPWLDGGADQSQADAARQLGMSESAVKVAIHRLRARFRELIRAEISATLDNPDDVADELRHLITIASNAG